MKEDIKNKNILSEKRKMEELDKCTIAAHAEMVRNSDADEPCDDGRA